MVQTYNFGLSHIGHNLALAEHRKQYLSGEINQKTLIEIAETYIEELWCNYQRVNLDILTVGDIYWHDHILSHSMFLGAVPPRFDTTIDPIELGRDLITGQTGIQRCSTKKLFGSNYEYVVPEIGNHTHFKLWDQSFFSQIARARELGYQVKPTLLGPASYLYLAQNTTDQQDDCSAFLNALLPVYLETFEKMSRMGVEWVQLEEPILSTTLTPKWLDLIMNSVTTLSGRNLKILLTSPNSILDNAEFIKQLPYEGIHLDCIKDPTQLDACKMFLDSDTVLSLAILDGASMDWKESNESTNLQAKLHPIADRLGANLWLTISYSNWHMQNDTSMVDTNATDTYSSNNKLNIFNSMEKYSKLNQIKTILNNS